MSETTPQPPRPARNRLRAGMFAATLLILGLVGAALLWHSTGDLDLLLHDRTGQDILAGGGIPRSNGYAFTAPDHPWQDHEWLFQVAVAASGDLGGQSAATRERAWRWLRLGLGLALLVALGRDLILSRPAPWLLGLVGLVGLSLLWTRLTLRPELVSYTLLVLVLGRVEAALRVPGDGASWREAVDPRRPAGQATWLTLFWYQVHGFAALAPLLWLLAAVFDIDAGPWPRRGRRATWGLGAALVAGMVTPAGPAGLLYPLHVLRQAGAGPDLPRLISELVPLFATEGSLATTLIMARVSAAVGLVWIAWNWPRVSWFRLVLWVLAAVAAWQGQRNLGLYAVCFALLFGGTPRAGSHLGDRLAHRWRRRAWPLGPATTLGLWIVAGLWLGSLASDRFYLGEGVARRFGAGLTPANYPIEPGRQLAERGSSRVAVTVDAASTVIHARAGQVNIDGRTEAYPAEIWRRYQEFKAGGPGCLRLLGGWQADAVCVVHRNPAARAIVLTLRDDPRWQVLAADAAGIAFVPTTGAPEIAWRDGARDLRDRLSRGAGDRDVRLADEAVAWAGLLGQFDDPPLAEDLLRLAEQACPDHPVVLHNLGNLLLARGEFTTALPRFEAAARLNRNAAPPLVNAGTCLFNLGRRTAAARAFAAAVRRDPGNFEGWANLAETRRQLGDREGAAEAYRRALALHPDDRRLQERARTL
ncbi:MAG: tetratricopeptide repeat protein [Candidatus Krumholzibacteriia bacterium]